MHQQSMKKHGLKMKINTDMSEAWMMYELSTLPKDYLDVTWLQKHSNSVTQEKLNM